MLSVYECNSSLKLVTIEGEGYNRTGAKIILVAARSALLGLPRRFEIPIPCDASHSNMTKMDHKNALTTSF